MRAILWSISLLLLIACGQQVLFEKLVSFDGGAWDYTNPASYNFKVEDTESKYNLFLNIEHTTDYPYENIYLKIKTKFPDQTTVSDTLSVQMIDNKGNWISKCSGEECLLTVFLQENIKFKSAGEYQIDIEQFTRKERLDGVNGLSFSIVATE